MNARIPVTCVAVRGFASLTFSFTLTYTKVHRISSQAMISFKRCSIYQPAANRHRNERDAISRLVQTPLHARTTALRQHRLETRSIHCRCSGGNGLKPRSLPRHGQHGVCACVSAATSHVRLHASLLLPRDVHAQPNPGVFYSMRVGRALLSGSIRNCLLIFMIC